MGIEGIEGIGVTQGDRLKRGLNVLGCVYCMLACELWGFGMGDMVKVEVEVLRVGFGDKEIGVE